MRMKIGITPDEPTINGRIYPLDMLVDAFMATVGKDIPITVGFQEGPVNLSRIVGFMKDFRVLAGEEVEVEVLYINDSYIEMINGGMLELKSAGEGKLNDSVVSEFKLTSFFLILKDDDFPGRLQI